MTVLIVSAVLIGLWILSCYYPDASAIWCKLGLLSPAGEQHLITLPGAYPAVGWTTASLLVDAALVIATWTLVDAIRRTESMRITADDGSRHTEWSFPSARLTRIYLKVWAICSLAAGLGVGVQRGWTLTLALPLVLGSLVLLAIKPKDRANASAEDQPETPVPDGLFAGLAEPIDMARLPRHFVPGGQLHPDIKRLVGLAGAKFPQKLALDVQAIELDPDANGTHKLLSWGFRCAESGFLTDTAVQQRLQTTFIKGLGGIWTFTFDPRSDTFGASRKSSVPTLVFPPHWPVVDTVDQAKKRYTGWELKLGVAARGQVGVVIEHMAHIKVIGETGAGKSAAIRAMLEQFRVAGWMMIAADGKGADYAGYFAPHPEDHGLPVPGMIAVGLGAAGRGMAYIGAIVLAYQIMQERQMGSMDAKIADPAGWNNFVPLLLVMDEIKGMREKWKSALSSEERHAVEGMVTELTSLGRELRVHLILISQDSREVSIPGVWNSNLPLTISIGKPSQMTVSKGFEDSVRPKVQMVREAMDPKIKGRCLMASVDPDNGAADALEYQGYFSYSPGESWNNSKCPPQAKAEWPPFKEQVSDRVPRLYTRQWFRIDEKSEAQLAAEERDGSDLGYIDFEMFTVDEIKQLDRVPLDIRRSDGTITPNPEMAKYDPASREYVCRPPNRVRRVTAEL